MTDALPPLHGIRVIELAHVMAGPTCGRLLADLGADVIKLERPGGEDSRKMAPPWQGGESSAYLMINRNKRGLCVDLKQEAGKAILKDLVRRADVLIENFRQGALDALGLGYAELSAVNPRLVWCAISGFGRTGPYAARGGYDLIVQAMAGLMSITGEGPGRPPVKVGTPIADIGAGVLAALGIVAALQARARTGLGQQVDTSLYEAAILQTFWQSAIAMATGETPQPMGSAHPLDAPYQAFETADGWLVVGAANQANWLRMLGAMGADALDADPRFASNPARMENLAALIDTLTPLFRARTTADWLALFENAGVPAGPVASITDMLADPQTVARDMVVEVEHPSAGSIRSLGMPIKFSASKTPRPRPAPRLGEHNRTVLSELGYSDQSITELEAAGVLGT
jgi:crotonobetainyl-CoA:carnitine CoA-transferase CaiB-like acyl-CoA transferase